MSEQPWPIAEFDNIRRLRVIAAATPGAIVHEVVLSAPLETVWAVAADLESELPRWLLPDIRSVRVTPSDGDRLVAQMRGYSGLRARFDVVLQPGWCLMQSRYLLGGMAATTEDDGTRFAFLGELRGPLRALNAPLRPIGERSGRHALRRFTTRVALR
jgi:hypothetical protein